MSAENQVGFLLERLRSFGLELALEPGSVSAVGELPMSATPLPTLERPVKLERARFYTLGHKHLKFFQPRVLFDLPPVDVSRCTSAGDVESSLRRAWSALQKDLNAARERHLARGSDVKPAVQGTRLQLTLSDEDESVVEIRSPRELLLPSSGPLSDVSLAEPRERRFRPLDGLKPSELELAISAEMSRAGRAARSAAGPAQRPALALQTEALDKKEHRVLLVAHQGSFRDELITELPARAMRPDVPRDPSRALDAFRRHSYELVLIQAQMPRLDGFELAARVRMVPGVDRVPIVVLEERDRDSSRRAAHAAGVSAYLPGPFAWDDAVSTLADLLDNTQQRRFSRFSARLPVIVAGPEARWDDLTEKVARGGLTLRTQREIRPGTDEVYRISLPEPLGAVELVGHVVSRVNLPGYASILAGVRIQQFRLDGESRWIRFIEALAAREAA